ncbi:hypothetical protein AKO1_014040 [Acrasis kona]|uniref:Uncharacterized protein n=1 Tax=Acrasis kona TaxID=1008807 RepID=A0AAW2Z4I9_9EUKA
MSDKAGEKKPRGNVLSRYQPNSTTETNKTKIDVKAANLQDKMKVFGDASTRTPRNSTIANNETEDAPSAPVSKVSHQPLVTEVVEKSSQSPTTKTPTAQNATSPIANSSTEDMVTALQRELKQQEGVNEQMLTKIKKLQGDLKKKDVQIKELKQGAPLTPQDDKKVEDLQKKLKQAQVDLEQAQKQGVANSSSNDAEITELLEVVSKLEGQNLANKERISVLEGQVKSRDAQLVDARKKKPSVSADNEAEQLRKQVQDLEDTIKEQQAAIDQLSELNDSLESGKSPKKNEDSYKQKYQLLLEQLKEDQVHTSAIEKQVQSLTDQLNKEKQARKDLEQKCKQLQNDKEDIQVINSPRGRALSAEVLPAKEDQAAGQPEFLTKQLKKTNKPEKQTEVQPTSDVPEFVLRKQMKQAQQESQPAPAVVEESSPALVKATPPKQVTEEVVPEFLTKKLNKRADQQPTAEVSDNQPKEETPAVDTASKKPSSRRNSAQPEDEAPQSNTSSVAEETKAEVELPQEQQKEIVKATPPKQVQPTDEAVPEFLTKKLNKRTDQPEVAPAQSSTIETVEQSAEPAIVKATPPKQVQPTDDSVPEFLTKKLNKRSDQPPQQPQQSNEPSDNEQSQPNIVKATIPKQVQSTSEVPEFLQKQLKKRTDDGGLTPRANSVVPAEQPTNAITTDDSTPEFLKKQLKRGQSTAIRDVNINTSTSEQTDKDVPEFLKKQLKKVVKEDQPHSEPTTHIESSPISNENEEKIQSTEQEEPSPEVKDKKKKKKKKTEDATAATGEEDGTKKKKKKKKKTEEGEEAPAEDGTKKKKKKKKSEEAAAQEEGVVAAKVETTAPVEKDEDGFVIVKEEVIYHKDDKKPNVDVVAPPTVVVPSESTPAPTTPTLQKKNSTVEGGPPKLARRASQIHKLSLASAAQQPKKVEEKPAQKNENKQLFVDELDDIINALEDNDPSLTVVDFSSVQVPLYDIHPDQIQDLAEMWGLNETVTHASFKAKGVNNTVASCIFPQLSGNLTLEEIDVSQNPLIDDSCVKAFESLITRTKTVVKLNLSGCSFGDKAKKALNVAQSKNTKLELTL